MLQNLFLIRLAFLAAFFAPSLSLPQTKSAAQAEGQTEKIDSFVREKMKSKNIPGFSLAVVRGGKIILAKGYGMANLELSTPATEKTCFVIYSITKIFTATATMMLVEGGQISLEDPISKYLKDLPVIWHPVTVHQLLNHTSGIKNWGELPFKPGDATRDYTQAEVIKLVADYPLDFPPGDRWAYNETGYFLLGMLIEKVSGKTYEQFLRERIFAPLEMHDTRLDNSAELIPNRADGYTWQNNGFRIAERPNPTLSFSIGGLVSTVIDLAKWDAALDTEKLLRKSTLEQMWTSAKLNNGKIVPDYGLGFNLTPFRGHKRVGHSGGHTGFATTITRFVDDKVTVIVLTNADQEGSSISEIAKEIASYYFQANYLHSNKKQTQH
jgi:D-alanyl-D-alanine carboxypeptidase